MSAEPDFLETVAADEQAVHRYWVAHYMSTRECKICGDRGTFQTRANVSTGLIVSAAMFCICPNGRRLRAAEAAIDPAVREDRGHG